MLYNVLFRSSHIIFVEINVIGISLSIEKLLDNALAAVKSNYFIGLNVLIDFS
jgi:hypothetical protein